MHCLLALGDVPLSCGLCKAPLAVGTGHQILQPDRPQSEDWTTAIPLLFAYSTARLAGKVKLVEVFIDTMLLFPNILQAQDIEEGMRLYQETDSIVQR